MELHDPIMINGNLDFAAMAVLEGWAGDGTAGDPYVIEGYEINGSAVVDAVAIWNTDHHFVIRNCSIHDAQRYGIYLSVTSHGLILNNTLSHPLALDFFSRSDVVVEASDNITLDSNTMMSARGNQAIDVILQDNEFASSDDIAIDLSASERIRVLNNSFSGFSWGVSLGWVSSAEVSNCTFDDVQSGIYLASCAEVNVVNNTFQGRSDRSIVLANTLYAVLSNNTMDEGGIEMLAFSVTEETWTTHSIDSSNAVAGRPVWYCNGQVGGSVPANVSQVLLANCSQMTVEGQTIRNVSVGISACFSDNCSISGNTLLGCNDGVLVSTSPDCIVEGNHLESQGSSILLHQSPNADVVSNLCAGSPWSYAGIETSGCDGVLVRNNTCMGESEYGISIYSSLNSTVLNNTCANCSIGILLEKSHVVPTPRMNQSADGNLLLNCSIGIMLYSSDSTLRNNTMVRCGLMPYGLVSELERVDIDTSNTVNGQPLVYLIGQDGGTVTEDAGQVILVNCTDVAVRDLHIENATTGILLLGSSANTVVNNTCISCRACDYYHIDRGMGFISILQIELMGAGIGLGGSSNNTVDDNLCDGCDAGLSIFYESTGLLEASGNLIANNTFESNEMGIYLGGDSNLITGNRISNSTYYGVVVYGDGNSIFLNDFLYNHGSSDSFSSSFVQACDDGVGNLWNSSDAGNFWSDWQTPNENGDGIVDDPYLINGSACAEDEFPLVARTTPIPEMSPTVMTLMMASVVCVLSLFFKNRRRI